jgi:hypothetical protein
MKINLESNFRLLGSVNIDSIDLNCTEITVKDFLQTIADRSVMFPQYIDVEGTGLQPGWQVHVNGRILDFCENGINAVLRDGDTVAVYIDVLDGG